METHRSISRTILLLPSAGIILPLAQTQVSLVVPLDGGVRTEFNLSLKWQVAVIQFTLPQLYTTSKRDGYNLTK